MQIFKRPSSLLVILYNHNYGFRINALIITSTRWTINHD